MWMLGDVLGEVLPIILGVLLVIFVISLILREYYCWYFKINARLSEQKRTNELLQNLFDASIQGNAVNAVTANQMLNGNTAQARPNSQGRVFNNDIPDL